MSPVILFTSMLYFHLTPLFHETLIILLISYHKILCSL